MAPPSTETLNGYLTNLPVGQPFRIVLSGGEPFWRKDIYDIIQHCACEPWATIVVTNGTFHIDFEALPKNMRFEFSLDAPNEVIYGSMRGGTPKQYQQLLQNVSDAVSRGYIVRLCYLMSRKNTTRGILRELLSIGARLGVQEIRLQRFKPWGAGAKLADEYEFSQQEYATLSKFLVNDARRYEGLRVIVPQRNRFLALGSVYLYPDGSVSIQDRDENEQTTIGNVHKESLQCMWSRVANRYSTQHLQWLIRPKRII